MSTLIRYTPSDDNTVEQYTESIKRVSEEIQPWPPEGLEYHCAFRTGESGFRVSEIWDTREHAMAFREQLVPVLQDMGITWATEPEEFEVLNQESTLEPTRR